MERDKRQLLMMEFFKSICYPLTVSKGSDYTQKGDDANSNFKRLAERAKEKGLDKFDIWWIYWMKHLDAIDTWVIHRQVESEPIASRIADAVNYLLIFMTMLVEDGVKVFPDDHIFGHKSLLEHFGKTSLMDVSPDALKSELEDF